MLIIIVIFSFCFHYLAFEYPSSVCFSITNWEKNPKLFMQFMQPHKSQHNTFYSWLMWAVWKHGPTTFCWKNVQWRMKKEASIDEHPAHTISGFPQESVIQLICGNGVTALCINWSINLGEQDLHLNYCFQHCWIHTLSTSWFHTRVMHQPHLWFFSLKGSLGLQKTPNYHFGLWKHLMRTFDDWDSKVCLVCLRGDYG